MSTISGIEGTFLSFNGTDAIWKFCDKSVIGSNNFHRKVTYMEVDA
jgi:hypothetical protein